MFVLIKAAGDIIATKCANSILILIPEISVITVMLVLLNSYLTFLQCGISCGGYVLLLFYGFKRNLIQSLHSLYLMFLHELFWVVRKHLLRQKKVSMSSATSKCYLDIKYFETCFLGLSRAYQSPASFLQVFPIHRLKRISLECELHCLKAFKNNNKVELY